MKTLQVLRSAYRCNLEEQDDPVLWITGFFRASGADVDVLLRDAAVNYVTRGQDSAGLQFGTCTQTHPPDPERDVSALLNSGARVFVVAEDLRALGVQRDRCLPEVTFVPAADLPRLFAEYERIWHW